MRKVLETIRQSKSKGDGMLTILLDPDKLNLKQLPQTIAKLPKQTNLLFVGGSTMPPNVMDDFVNQLKQHTNLPVVLFPGDVNQLTNRADALLFLSLLSGRNPEYLIGQQVKAAPFLSRSLLEVIPTGYLLIDGGVETAVQKVSETQPLAQSNLTKIVNTALAAEYMGKQLLYLEAGSGAKKRVSCSIIEAVSKAIKIPLIVGGGIRTEKQINQAYKSGADMVVIGTAFENNNSFLKQ